MITQEEVVRLTGKELQNSKVTSWCKETSQSLTLLPPSPATNVFVAHVRPLKMYTLKRPSSTHETSGLLERNSAESTRSSVQLGSLLTPWSPLSRPGSCGWRSPLAPPYASMALLAVTLGVRPRSALSRRTGLPESPPRTCSWSFPPILWLWQPDRLSAAALPTAITVCTCPPQAAQHYAQATLHLARMIQSALSLRPSHDRRRWTRSIRYHQLDAPWVRPDNCCRRRSHRCHQMWEIAPERLALATPKLLEI